MIRTVILTDNLPGNDLGCEWGFSAYLETETERILLDTGSSGLFAENAAKLGIDLACVDFGVLSHAHYDHADGMETFFARNETASFYLRNGCFEDCYSRKEDGMKYIGIREGILSAHTERICFVNGNHMLKEGVFLLPHSEKRTTDLSPANHLFRRDGSEYRPDDFCHEQTLVLIRPDGLWVYNSCSHVGVDRILREVAKAFPRQRVAAYIGGFHLYESADAEIDELADRLSAVSGLRLYTGHCTGEAAFARLHAILGDRISYFHTGMTIWGS